MEVNGYLEVNGVITKITSIDALKNFVRSLGESVNEPTEEELAYMCSDKFEDTYSYTDDCRVSYSDKNRLLTGNIELTTYNVCDGTNLIRDNAFYWLNGRISKLKSLLIKDSVIAIGREAFFC